MPGRPPLAVCSKEAETPTKCPTETHAEKGTDGGRSVAAARYAATSGHLVPTALRSVRRSVYPVSDYVDEDGRHHDLDAEQAKYASSWRFKMRYLTAEPTYIASARRKAWPLHGFEANADTEDEARAQLLSLMAEMLG